MPPVVCWHLRRRPDAAGYGQAANGWPGGFALISLQNSSAASLGGAPPLRSLDAAAASFASVTVSTPLGPNSTLGLTVSVSAPTLQLQQQAAAAQAAPAAARFQYNFSVRVAPCLQLETFDGDRCACVAGSRRTSEGSCHCAGGYHTWTHPRSVAGLMLNSTGGGHALSTGGAPQSLLSGGSPPSLPRL